MQAVGEIERRGELLVLPFASFLRGSGFEALAGYGLLRFRGLGVRSTDIF